MHSPSSSPVASQASEGQRESSPLHDPDYHPDPFTGRFSGLLSNLGEKREVEGTYAHHLDNGKAIRSEGVTHAPPLALSDAYEREICPPRKKFLQRLDQSEEPEPRTPLRVTQRSQSRNALLGRITTRKGPPPIQNVALRTIPSVPGQVHPQRNVVANAPQGADGSVSVPVHPEAIIALQTAWRQHGDGTNLDYEAAHRKWLEITDQQRAAVVQFYRSVRATSASQVECGEPTTTAAVPTNEPYANEQHARVLDQLLMEVDQYPAGPSGSGQPIHRPSVETPAGVIYHPQPTRPATLEDADPPEIARPTSHVWEQRAGSRRDVHHDLSAVQHPLAPFVVGLPIPASLLHPPPPPTGEAFSARRAQSTQAINAVPRSMHAPAPQPQFTPQEAPMAGVSGSMHAPAPQPQFTPQEAPMTGVSGSMHAPAPQPQFTHHMHAPAPQPPFAHHMHAPAPQPQFTPQEAPMAGVSGSMHAPAPQSPFAHHMHAPAPQPQFAHHMHAPAPQPQFAHHMHAPAPQPQFTPQEAPMAGVSGSMHAPYSQPQFAHQEALMAGVWGATHVPYPQPQFARHEALMAGGTGSMHAPASQPLADGHGFIQDTSGQALCTYQVPQYAGGQDFVSTTPPVPEGAWGNSQDPALPFFDDMDTGIVLDKGKGRARDVEMTVPPREDQEPSETHTCSPRSRLPSMDGQLQGDVSGPLNPTTTLAFLKSLNGLAVVIEDQTQEFRTLRETFEDRMNAQADVTDPSSTSPSTRTGPSKQSAPRSRGRPQHEDVSLRMQKRQKRVEQKVTRLRGAKSQSGKDSNGAGQMELDDEELGEHLSRLRARLRHSFDEVLHITDWADVYHMYPPLTNDQLALYKARDATIVPTVKNLRIDFQLGWSKPFNREARAAFIDRYLERVENGSYAKNPTPPQLMTRECIGDILDGQMTHYRQKWRRSKSPLTPDQLARLARAACQRSRKRTLHESREALLLRRGYTRHVRFFKVLEPVHMSGDETDGETKTHPPKWRIIVARWQSAELRNFLWEIDRMYREDWGHPPHKRATGGNPPRDRVLRSGLEDGVTRLGREEDGVAPPGLWRNCYDNAWLEQQAPHVISELDIVDEDYDFTL